MSICWLKSRYAESLELQLGEKLGISERGPIIVNIIVNIIAIIVNIVTINIIINFLIIMIFIKIGRETDALGEIQHHQAFDSFWGRSVLLLSQKFWVRIYDHIIFSKTLTLSLPLSSSWWFLVRHHWHHDLTSDIMIWHLSQASGATRKGEPNGSPPLSSKGRLQINIVMTIRVN